MIYVVVGEWKGVVQNVEPYLDKNRAEMRKQEIIDEYGRDSVEAGESTVEVHPKEVAGGISCLKCGSIISEINWRKHGKTLVCPACGGIK